MALVSLHVGNVYTTMNHSIVAAYRQIDWAKKHFAGDKIQVASRTLDNILKSEGMLPGFELLVVDVEGAEETVFRGFDLERWEKSQLYNC